MKDHDDKQVLKLLNSAYMGERWAEARVLIRRWLRKSPFDHWLLTRLASTYYEQRRYRRALQYSKRAARIAPRCPLVTWDYASSLAMVGQERKAIGLLRRLIARGVRAVATEECGEGQARARDLINDSRYGIARTYERLGQWSMASRYLRAYLRGRNSGARGIYSKPEAARRLRALEALRSGKAGVPGRRRS